MLAQQNVEESKKVMYKDIVKSISQTCNVEVKVVHNTLIDYKLKLQFHREIKKKFLRQW